MRWLLSLLLLLLLVNCATPISKEAAQVQAYYEGFKNSNYDQIKETIADSFAIIEGDFTMRFNKESYYQHFAWDSIFKPVYQLDRIYKEKQYVIATASVQSQRFLFLQNNPLTCTHKFQFKEGKISRMTNLGCPGAHWITWKQQVDTLVNWTRSNHPELDGFINDQSMQGAQNYLKAIELYQRSQSH